MQDPLQTDLSGTLQRRALNFVLRYSGPVLVVATALLGWWGYATECPREGDNLYRALQHFALATDTQCEYGDLSALNIARFMAAFLLAFAVIKFLFSQIWEVLKLKAQAFLPWGVRYILIGHGAINQEIARTLVARNKRLTIVARSFDAAAREFAAANRVVLRETDVRNERALRGLHMGRAKAVIVACGDDSLTLEIAQSAGALMSGNAQAEGSSEHRIFAHFSNPEVHRQLQLTSDAGLKMDRKFTGFSIREEAARHLFSHTWLAERAAHHTPSDGSKPRLHVAVVGAGDLGMAMIREAVIHGCSARLGRPLITVIDWEKDGGKARVQAAMPRLFDDTIPEIDRPEFRFEQKEADAICIEAGDAHDDATPITGWVICCAKDDTNLSLAMRLEGEMLRGLRPPAPIYPRIWQANVRGGPAALIGQEDAWHLVAPFGGMQDVIPSLTILNDTLTQLAQSIHAHYKQTVDDNYKYRGLDEWKLTYGLPPWGPEEGPEDVDLRAKLEQDFALEQKRFKAAWPKLDDEGRLSNYASAHQAALRLWELGFDWKGRYAGVLPHIRQPMIDRIFDAAALANLCASTPLGAACAAEHRRFMVERALRGWGAAIPKQRSNRLRLHPDFRTYDVLYDAAKADVLDKKSEAEDGSLRMLDAATIRGIMTALSQTPHPNTGLTNPARPSEDRPEFSLAEMSAVLGTTYRLSICVPAANAPDGRDMVPAMQAGQRILSDWITGKDAFVIRFRPDTPEVWADKRIKEIMETLHKDARDHDVTLLVDHADASAHRAKTARPPESPAP